MLFDYFVVVGLVPLPPSPDDDEGSMTLVPQVKLSLFFFSINLN